MRLLDSTAAPNNALQRTEAGGGVCLELHVLLRQPLSLSLDSLGTASTWLSSRIAYLGVLANGAVLLQRAGRCGLTLSLRAVRRCRFDRLEIVRRGSVFCDLAALPGESVASGTMAEAPLRGGGCLRAFRRRGFARSVHPRMALSAGRAATLTVGFAPEPERPRSSLTRGCRLFLPRLTTRCS